jgi:hypothetical protein
VDDGAVAGPGPTGLVTSGRGEEEVFAESRSDDL